MKPYTSLFLFKFPFLIFLSLFAVQLHAQNITVKDGHTNERITNYSVEINTSQVNNQKETPTEGFTPFIAEAENYKFSKIGYRTSVLLTPYQIKEDSFIVYLFPSALGLDEVVVSANRFYEQKHEVPKQIDVFTSKQIQRSNQQQIADMLQSTGSVFVQRSQGGGGSPVIRGFEANKILLVIDGVRMNNAIYRGGHLQNVLRVDQNMLERIEVVYGPGSVVYGSDALGGVIHMMTFQPQFATDNKVNFNLNASTSYSTVNQYSSTHVRMNFGWKKVALLSGFTYSHFGDLTQGSNRPVGIGNLGARDSVQSRVNQKDIAILNSNPLLQTPSGYNQLDIYQKVKYKSSNHIEHLVNFQYSITGNVPRYDRLTERNVKTGTFNSAEWYYGPELRLLTSYQCNITKKHLLFDQLNSQVAFQQIEESRHNRNFNSNFRSNRIEQVKLYSFNSDAEKRLGKIEMRYGLELCLNDVKSTANKQNILTNEYGAQTTRYPDGGSTMKLFGVYYNHAVEINKGLFFTGGLRWSYVSTNVRFIDKSFYSFLPNQITQNNQAFNGQLGLSFHTPSEFNFAISMCSGFRAPNVDDIGKSFESAGGEKVILPNASVKPEYVYSIDFRISKLLWSKVNAGVCTYYTIMKDGLGVQYVPINGKDSLLFDGKMTRIAMVGNLQESHITGLNIFLNMDASKHLSFSNTFNYTYGSVNTSPVVPLDHIPPYFGKSAVTFNHKNFRTDFYMMYQGAKPLSSYSNSGEDNFIYATANGMPAWYTLNVQVSFSKLIKDSRIKLQASIENILDRNYRIFASGISSPGRNLALTLRYDL